MPWFSLSLHLVMHLQVISMKRWRVPGMALWRSWPSLWELPVPPFYHRPHSLVETHTALRWNLSISPWGGHTVVKPLSVFAGNLLTLSVDWLPGTWLIYAQSSSSPCPDSFAEPSHKPTRKPPGRAQTEAHTEQTHTWALGYSSQSYFTFPVSLQLWV